MNSPTAGVNPKPTNDICRVKVGSRCFSDNVLTKESIRWSSRSRQTCENPELFALGERVYKDRNETCDTFRELGQHPF